MQVRSVGLQTDLEIVAMHGTIVDRGDYLVARSPNEPDYYYGNLLVLPAAPQVGEVAYWTRRYAEELGDTPAIRHVTLAWDGIAGDIGAVAELTAAGFAIERTLVMTASRVAPAPYDGELRELAPGDFDAVAELSFAIADRHDDGYRRFLERRAARERDLVERGLARFFGAFAGATLIGSLGLVPLGARARYQDVQVASAHRRRRIATALLAAAAATTTAQLIIVTTPGSAAEQVYARAGFTPLERIASACKAP
jgi:GNAT superfamily N-acetyltransferase